MTEPDVALTDYALAIECALLAWLLPRRGDAAVDQGTGPAAAPLGWFRLFFASIGLAALLGGTYHGFLRDTPGLLRDAVWKGTLLTIGVTALAGWMIGAALQASRAVARLSARLAWTALGTEAVVVLFFQQNFLVAVLAYLPAVLFLLAVLCLRCARHPSRAALLGPIGLSLSLVASALQQARVGIHPAYFNHNTLYHALQGMALLLLYLAWRRVPQGERLDGPLPA
jgi:hypothetical protein